MTERTYRRIIHHNRPGRFVLECYTNQTRYTMNFLFSIILGGIAGYLASVIMGSHNSALVNIILGIVGGLVGGFIARQLGNRSENDGMVMHLLISVVGAIVLIFIGRLF